MNSKKEQYGKKMERNGELVRCLVISFSILWSWWVLNRLRLRFVLKWKGEKGVEITKYKVTGCW